jgi:hypothetical protein
LFTASGVPLIPCDIFKISEIELQKSRTGLLPGPGTVSSSGLFCLVGLLPPTSTRPPPPAAPLLRPRQPVNSGQDLLVTLKLGELDRRVPDPSHQPADAPLADLLELRVPDQIPLGQLVVHLHRQQLDRVVADLG